MSVLCIVNPASAGGTTGRHWPAMAERLQRELPEGITPLLTTHRGHATELAEQAGGSPMLLAVGGDGTLNEVINGLMRLPLHRRPAVALIPNGTGSDFARMYGHDASLDSVIARVRRRQTELIDVGESNYATADGPLQRFFVNIAGLGFDAEVSHRVNSGHSKGRLTYFRTVFRVLRRYGPRPMRVTLDGETGIALNAFMVAICNGRYFGGGMHVSPASDPRDGMFDVIIIGKMSALEFALNFPRVYRGAHLTHRRVRAFRAHTVQVDPVNQPLLLESDGEMLGAAPAHFRVLPQALRIVT
jgi:YegS/Rv2252/BmrU family lipid kinase